MYSYPIIHEYAIIIYSCRSIYIFINTRIDDFQNVRNFIRNKLENALRSSGLLPPTSQINIFGSSQNNFGSENADCDMCISYPGCEQVNREDKVSK